MIRITNQIPVPETKPNYPFENMKVGDSFVMECNSGEEGRLRHNMLCAARRHAQYHELKRKYISRSYPGKARIWRVE